MRLTALSLLILLALVMLSGFSQQKPNYYRHIYVDGRYQIVGSFPLSDREAAGKMCYHFIYDEQNRPVSVEYLVSGYLSGDSYFGKSVASLEIAYSDGFQDCTFKDIYGNTPKDRTSVSSYRLILNDKGHPVSKLNYNANNKLTLDSEGVAQYYWTLDSQGRRISSMRLDENGHRITDRSGIYTNRIKYDRNGFICQRSSYGIDGELSADSTGVAIVKYTFDDMGKEIERSYFGTDELPVLDRKMEVSRMVTVYNEIGNPIERRNYGTDGRIKLDSNGIAIYRIDYNDHGNYIRSSYYGTDDNPIEYEGAASLVYIRDSRGNVSQWITYGIDGNPTSIDGVVSYRHQFDEYRNVTEYSKHDLSGNLVETEGFAIKRMEYDNKGRRISITHFDQNLEKCLIESDRLMFHRVDISYDALGYDLENRFFGITGAPHPQEYLRGAVAIRWVRNESGEATKTQFISADGTVLHEF